MKIYDIEYFIGAIMLRLVLPTHDTNIQNVKTIWLAMY